MSAHLQHEAEGDEDEVKVGVVVFRLGAEFYACEVSSVEEVVTDQPIHSLADIPPPLLGVVRIRGALLPVVDIAPALGLRLGEAATPAVLVVDGPAGRVGIAVDEVHQVTALPPGAIRAIAGAATEEQGAGVTHLGGELVSILDLARVLGGQMNQTAGGDT